MGIWEFDVQGLVNRVRAVVKLDVKDEELQEALRWATVWEIREFNMHDLANGVRAFATLDVKDEELLDAVRWATVWKIWEINAQDLANRVRAFAKLDVKDEERLEAAGGRPEYQGVQRTKLSENGVGLREVECEG